MGHSIKQIHLIGFLARGVASERRPRADTAGALRCQRHQAGAAGTFWPDWHGANQYGGLEHGSAA
jgi:hypothetical protein